MPPRVIVTYARSWYSLSAIRSLGRHGVEVIAADEVAPTPGSLSRYAVDSFTYANPETDPEAFVRDLSDAIERFTPEDGSPYVLLPMHRETYAIARYRDVLPPQIAVPVCRSELIEEVRDKGRLVELCRRHGVTVPETRIPGSSTELDAALEELSYPLFVKIPTGAGGVGLEKANNPEEARAAYLDLSAGGRAPLVQEGVPGDDYCVSGLFDSGELIASLVYRNRLAFPEDGPGAIRESVSAPELEAIAGRFLGELGWHGIAQIDFRWTGDAADEPALIEVNPRFFGGLFHAISAGVDYPWYLYQLAIGSTPVIGPVDLELVSESPVTAFLATVADVASLATPELLDDLKAAWSTERESMSGQSLWKQLSKSFGAAIASVSATASDRLDQIRDIIDTYRGSESAIELDDDPLPLLGLMYPLAFFVRHGKLDGAVLTWVGARAER